VLTQQCRQRCASPSRRFVVTLLDLGHAGAAIQRQHRDRLPHQFHELLRHGVPLQFGHFDDRLGMRSAAQKLVNPHRRALAVAHAVNDQPRPKHAIAAGEDPRRRRHQRMRIHIDQPARRNFHAIVRPQEIEVRGLADRHDDRVALDLRLAVLDRTPA
jgi:hypothetical protein